MYLLDTDTLTYLQTGHPRVVEKFQELAEDDAGTTIISVIEMLQGRFAFILKAATGSELLRAQEWLNRTDEFLAPFTVYTLNQSAVDHFNHLRVVPAYRKIGRADLLIASITLANHATLVTRNIKHFNHIPNLKIENWVD
jgi:tRNA(fMet)-specific endonuclease VapC